MSFVQSFTGVFRSTNTKKVKSLVEQAEKINIINKEIDQQKEKVLNSRFYCAVYFKDLSEHLNKSVKSFFEEMERLPVKYQQRLDRKLEKKGINFNEYTALRSSVLPQTRGKQASLSRRRASSLEYQMGNKAQTREKEQSFFNALRASVLPSGKGARGIQHQVPIPIPLRFSESQMKNFKEFDEIKEIDKLGKSGQQASIAPKFSSLDWENIEQQHPKVLKISNSDLKKLEQKDSIVPELSELPKLPESEIKEHNKKIIKKLQGLYDSEKQGLPVIPIDENKSVLKKMVISEIQ